MTLPRVRSVDREPIVYNDNEPTRVPTCACVMTTGAFSRPNQHRAKALPAAVLERRQSQKRPGDAWVSFHPTDVVNLAW